MDGTLRIDARGLHYKELNARLREAANGYHRIDLLNVFGQRYIGTDIHRPLEIHIYGVPGNDLGSFMDGPSIIVHGNAQDGVGNTMNSGEVIVHGHAGDILALSARGGRVFVRDGVGYRAGIHMKEYQGKRPMVVIGDTAQDFLGEYMGGGVLLVLGLGERHHARFIGTGMHGGVIYLRGEVEGHQLGKEVGVAQPDENDRKVIEELVRDYCSYFGKDPEAILSGEFRKLFPLHLRPYGNLYAY